MTKTPKNQSLMRWALFAVLTFTALIFARSVFNGFVSLDDETYILGNPYIRDFSVNGIKTIFSKFYFGMYHPITMLSYLIEYTLFGADPLPYHFVNVLLHLLNTLIVFRLAERLSEKKWTAVVVSLLFAVHPMHVESVAWVSERKDLLYALFYLLSLSLYVRYLKSDYKVKWYVFSGVFFILSLLSKPAAITLPVLLFAFDFYVARKWSFKVMAEKIPLLILSVAFGIMALSSVKQETYEFLATSYGVGERIAIISYNVAFYLVKLFAPLQLSAIYYYPNPDVGGLPWYYFASIPFLMILAFLIYKNRWYRREVIFAFAFFLITVSVMLQIVPNGLAVVCDRYTYVPYLGFFFVAGKWVADMIAAGKKKSVLVGFFTVTIIFSMITWNRIGIWKNGEILMTDVIRKSPDIFHCYWMRGNIRNKSGNLKGALQDYNKTIGYDPSYHLAYSDRSTVRQALGDVKGAVEDLNKAINLAPSVAKQYNNRAAMFEQLGDLTSALNDYNKAIELDPDLTEAYINRSVLKARSNDIAGAMTDIEKSIELSPMTAETYSTRGTIKSMMKDYIGAVEDIKHSLQLKPGDTLAYYNLGLLYLFMNDTSASCGYIKRAVELGSNSAKELSMKYCR